MSSVFLLVWMAGTLAGGARAWAGTCQVEGPGLKETQDYIKSLAHLDKLASYADGTIYASTNDYEWRVSALRLDCSSHGVARLEVGDPGPWGTYVSCSDQEECVDKRQLHQALGGYNQYHPNVFGLYGYDDADAAARLDRALSHYVYLVQQQYKAAHANDPFATPK